MIKYFLSGVGVFLFFQSCSEDLAIITIDTHDDINIANFTDSLNYTMNTETQVNLPKMIAGGLDVAWFVVYTAQGELNEEGYAKAEEMQLQNLMRYIDL